MGTPEFAVPSLKILVTAGYPVVGVVTATDKRGGRGGKQLLEAPVKKAAQALGIPVLQPKNLKDPAFHAELFALKPDLQVVVAFRMLPESVWALPPLGTINLHGSLLPKYRGAAPINWAVINGETETGATTFIIQKEIDTGDLLQQTRIPIGPDDTAGDVHDRMMVDGAELLLRTVDGLAAGSLEPTKQDDARATPAPKIHRDTCRIDFDRPAAAVHNFIRGLSPYPAAWTEVDGEAWKLIRSRLTEESTDLPPGAKVETDDRLAFACQDRLIEVLEVQVPGKRRMEVGDFLRGRK